MAVSTANANSREEGRAPLPLTSRHDTWWIRPVVTMIVLGAFVIYSTWRAFVYKDYEVDSYLSPFYSPFFPIKLNILGYLVSPAFYILIFPLSFRLTCYYYRLSYYRAFFRLCLHAPSANLGPGKEEVH